MISQYFDKFEYYAQIKNLNLNLLFVNPYNDSSSTRFSRQDLGKFLNSYVDNSPFKIQVVEHQYSKNIYSQGNLYSHKPWYSSLDGYMKLYQNSVDIFCNNYLAISPDQKTKLIVRNNELIYFAKYFENWTLDLIVQSTTRIHIKQYNLFHNVISPRIGFDMNLGQSIAVTLICSLIINSDNKQLPLSLNWLKEDYTKMGVIEEFMSIKSFCAEWILFCKLLQFKHNPRDLVQNDYELALSSIFELAANYYDYHFFYKYHQSFEKQKMVVDTLPFNSLNHELIAL